MDTNQGDRAVSARAVERLDYTVPRLTCCGDLATARGFVSVNQLNRDPARIAIA
jgi:hypothetical protein